MSSASRRGSVMGPPPVSPTSNGQPQLSARRPSRIADGPPVSARRASRIDAGPQSTPRGRPGMEESTPQRSARGGAPPSSARRGSVLGNLEALQTTGNAMKVFVRVRPFSQREIASKEPVHSTIRIDSENPSIITILEPSKEFRPSTTYSFTRCFWSVYDEDNTRQQEAVEKVLNTEAPPRSSRARAGSVTGGSLTSARRQSVVAEPPARAPTGGSNPCAVDSHVKHPAYAGQSEVYEYVGKPVLENTLDGYNGCVFAYGQTGSGKTFTMMGYMPKKSKGAKPVTPVSPASPASPKDDDDDEEEEEEVVLQTTSDPNDLQGIIPRVCTNLFKGLQEKRNTDESLSYRIEVSYFEIYNEKVFDLIRPQSEDLKIRNDPTTGPYVENLMTKVVTKEEDIARIIQKGTQERHTAATKYNDRSSRSHAILSINITQFFLEQEDTMKMQSKLNLVDLAGSERTGKGGAEGIEKKTGININLSLTVLGRVIDGLADLSQNKALAVPVPYRESNLTWLLSDSIGGNSQTSMVATISPHSINYEEMRQTLRYASRAKQIIQKAKRNEDPQVRQIKILTAEVERLNTLLKEAGGSNYTNEYVQGLEKRIKQLEKKVSEQERIIGGLRALLDDAGIADPTLEEGFSDDSAMKKAALAAKKAKDEMQHKLEEAQMAVAQMKAELERRSEIQPDELVKLKDQLAKQAKVIALQRCQVGNYKEFSEDSRINEVMLLVMEKENYFIQQLGMMMFNTNTSAAEAVKLVNEQRDEEIEQLKNRHKELLAEQGQQFQVKLKRVFDDTDSEIEKLKEAQKAQMAQMEERMKRMEELHAEEKARLERENENISNTMMEGLRKQREAHEEELARLRARLETDVGDRKKQSEESRQQLEANRREIDRLKEELDRLKRDSDNEITRLKNQLETEKVRRESDLMEKDRQRRAVEQEAADLRRDLMKMTSEINKVEKDYQEQVRELLEQQDQLINVSNSLLGEWENKGSEMETDMSKLRALVYNQDYINFRQKMRDKAFAERRDYTKEIEEVDARARRESLRLNEILMRAKNLQNQESTSLSRFNNARTRKVSNPNSPPPETAKAPAATQETK